MQETSLHTGYCSIFSASFLPDYLTDYQDTLHVPPFNEASQTIHESLFMAL